MLPLVPPESGTGGPVGGGVCITWGIDGGTTGGVEGLRFIAAF